jgi:hypothetical protein
MKNSVFVITVVLLFFYLAIPYTATATVNVEVGVKNGDWMKYDLVSEERNFTGWHMISVFSVDGTFFRFNTTTYSDSFGYHNETGVYNMSEMDSNSIKYPNDTIEFLVIPSNLKTGDTFYYYNWGSTTIAGEDTETLGGAARQLIYATYLPPTGMNAEATRVDYKWDKTTGIVVQYLAYYPDGKTTSAKLIETNVWQPDQNVSPYLWYAMIIAVTIIVAVSLLLVIRRRKRKP